MSGECGEKDLECGFDIGCLLPGSEIKAKSIPDPQPTFSEVSKQMRINVDILKEEITQHINSELVRFKNEVNLHEQIKQFLSNCYCEKGDK